MCPREPTDTHCHRDKHLIFEEDPQRGRSDIVKSSEFMETAEATVKVNVRREGAGIHVFMLAEWDTLSLERLRFLGWFRARGRFGQLAKISSCWQSYSSTY